MWQHVGGLCSVNDCMPSWHSEGRSGDIQTGKTLRIYEMCWLLLVLDGVQVQNYPSSWLQRQEVQHVRVYLQTKPRVCATHVGFYVGVDLICACRWVPVGSQSMHSWGACVFSKMNPFCMHWDCSSVPVRKVISNASFHGNWNITGKALGNAGGMLWLSLNDAFCNRYFLVFFFSTYYWWSLTFIQHTVPVICLINLRSFLAEYKWDEYVYTHIHKYVFTCFWWTAHMLIGVTVCLAHSIVLVVIKGGFQEGVLCLTAYTW